jgi:hypothetical protein
VTARDRNLALTKERIPKIRFPRGQAREKSQNLVCNASARSELSSRKAVPPSAHAHQKVTTETGQFDEILSPELRISQADQGKSSP